MTYCAAGTFIASELAQATNIFTAAAAGIGAGLGILIASGGLAGQLPLTSRFVLGFGFLSLIVALGLGQFDAEDALVASFVGIFGFFTLLPLVNGVFDGLSWAVSRSLARRLQTDHTLKKFITHVLIVDLSLAIALLVIVPVTWALGLALSNTVMDLFGVPMSFDFGPLLARAALDPLTSGEGLWFSLMIATNLFPTMLHVAIALVGLPIGVLPLQTRKRVADRFRAKQDLDAGLFLLMAAGLLSTGVLFVVGIGIYNVLESFGADPLAMAMNVACASSGALGMPCDL